MAKDKESSVKKGRALLNILIVLIIFVMWIAFFSLLIKFDVGGFGTLLRPYIKDIPIVNMVLPNVDEGQIAEENDYPYSSLAAAMERIYELEAELEDNNSYYSDSAKTISELQAEIERLKVFEDNQLEFEERVLEFETNVVFAQEAPDIEEYKAYYEGINPTNAETIYRQVIEQLQYEQAIIDKANIYKSMKPEAAASILENMTADLESVAKILSSMKPKESGEILAEMDPLYAAKVTKKMLDIDEQNR